MKKHFNKIIATLLILAFIFPYMSLPRKAEAILGAGDTVTEIGPSLYQQIIIGIEQTASTISEYSLQLKEYVLDGLATLLVKQIIRQITASVVNWINNGFEGSPAFITNPSSFFLDVADQITGDFLAKTGGPLRDLCSPFSIDIRLALAFKYHPNVQRRYECTIGTIIKNSKNAIKGASINGFTAGDFRQGGWPAFVSLTTEPQNNVIGAYLEAESELSIRVANYQSQKREEISQGRGFLSWRDPSCAKEVKANNEAISKTFDGEAGTEDSGYNSTVQNYNSGGDTSSLNYKSKLDCPIRTPGSTIVSSLEANVNGPLHELQLADEINEIINALFAQLVTQVLSAGLGAVSGSSPSDSTSYIYQIQSEAASVNNPQFQTTRDNLIENINTYITNTLNYKDSRDKSLQLIIDVRNTYDSAKACYTNKITNSQPPLSPATLTIFQNKITEIDNAINTTVSPLAVSLLTKAQEADDRLSRLTNLRTKVRDAKTLNDLNLPSQEYSQLVLSQRLTNGRDIVTAQQELEENKGTAESMKQDSQRRLQECQVAPSQ